MMSNKESPQTGPPELQALQHTGIVIPTCNAGKDWKRLHAALEKQGISPRQVLIVDSASTDGTQLMARRAGYRVIEISRETFRHGATRQMAASFFPKQETLIFLTQDAIPCGRDAFAALLRAFNNPDVGAAYGRQVARDQAGPLERHARLFNYPDSSAVRDLQSREELGFRAAFFSNSFAAYRRSAFDEVGGFPSDTIVSEEVTVAARMLLAGWHIAYQADATATHSHDFSLWQEFQRYFDIGVHHGRSRWLLDQFGTAGGEGRAFVLSQMSFLWGQKPLLVPLALSRNVSKWISYKMGLHERWLPFRLKTKLSAQKSFWLDEAAHAEEEAKFFHPKLMS